MSFIFVPPNPGPRHDGLQCRRHNVGEDSLSDVYRVGPDLRRYSGKPNKPVLKRRLGIVRNFALNWVTLLMKLVRKGERRSNLKLVIVDFHRKACEDCI